MLAGAAKASFALLVGQYGEIQGLRIEIRPQRLGKIHFGISHLPQQEIADALFAAGADKKIRLGCVMHRQVGRKIVFVEALRKFWTVQEHALHRLHDIPASSIVRGYGQRELGIVGGKRFRFADQFGKPRLKTVDVAHHFEADVVFMQPSDFLFQRQHEQLHQHRDFFLRAAPVFAAEGEQCEELHAPFGTGLDDFSHRFNSALVPGYTGQETLLGPPAIAIHDDGNMARNFPGLRNFLG